MNKKLLVLLASLVLMPIARADATVIYENAGGLSEFTNSEGWVIGASPFGFQFIAMPFTLPKQSYVTGAELALTALADWSRDYAVQILGDSGGLPSSSLLWTASLLQTIPVQTPQQPTHAFTAVTGESTLLEADTKYWLYLTCTPNCSIYWWWPTTSNSPPGAVLHPPEYPHFSAYWTLLDIPRTNPSMFRIIGSASAIPEPTTFALLSLGFAGLGVRRWRKKSQPMNKKLLILIALLFISSPAWALPSYTITDLGTTMGGDSFATGINIHGQVIGYSYADTGWPPHAFLYSNGITTDLGTLGGEFSYAYGINNNGQVVGVSQTNTSTRAFLYVNGVMTAIGTLGGAWSAAYDINDNGQIIGESARAGDTSQHAFLHSNGVMIDLGTLGGANSAAFGINDSGKIIGNSGIAGNNVTHAFLYTNSAMTDIPAPYTQVGSYATGINNNGQVIGAFYTTVGGSTRHAFLYSGGPMTDLGTLGGATSVSYGISDNGQVVGASFTTGNLAVHAFLYADDHLVDLNSLLPTGSGWTLNEAKAINDKSQIVGNGVINGRSHAFLMSPITESIPEPTTLALLSLGLAGLCVRRRRKSVVLRPYFETR
ncbi:PEP-CTERM sorting domain-containing protein [Candidatus Contendibacter odensensis]|uniref:Ice-binding protein C-terminal domain-containing protein n=1 Tax=Candidatus Contendobacter odensis Run_B_J11 TaxID=1400861 RepID=A0A7U7J3S4_9GAMM|nr:PEP-CTERM sorting domain-containing protein [Candidatus Contendobacter odensis]CDH44634.1 membrane hypothetical protein [Candidatus Contendobacter odensis Run_B_J11]